MPSSTEALAKADLKDKKKATKLADVESSTATDASEVLKKKPVRRKRRTKAEMEAAKALKEVEKNKKIIEKKEPLNKEKKNQIKNTIATPPQEDKKTLVLKKEPSDEIKPEKAKKTTEDKQVVLPSKEESRSHHKRGRKPRTENKTHKTPSQSDKNTEEEVSTTDDHRPEKRSRPQPQRGRRNNNNNNNNNRRKKIDEDAATSDEAKGEQMHLREVASLHPKAILELAESVNIENASSMRKAEQVFAILKAHAARGGILYSEGVLEVLPDGFGFLRSPEANYMTGPDDVYVSNHQIRRFSLRKGDTITGEIRSPRSSERYFALKTVDAINSHEPREAKTKVLFDNLTPLYPDERFHMEVPGSKDLTGRVIDLVAPIGKGQRGLLVAPPRTGKTVMMQSIAHSIEANHPDSTLMVLLIDERPEEVTDMKRSVKGEVVASTFDEPAQHHVQVAEMVIEKAKRLVEHGEDVIVLLDSITRLARAYNTVSPSSGKILSGGVDSNALHRPKRFFGAARNIEDGGSLTIIATALIDTGSRMDEVIFEEFKGTGNMEIHLSRKLMDKRVFPAIDMAPSGTRKEELLLEQSDMAKVWVLRRILSPMGTADSMEFLLEKLRQHPTNSDFFLGMNQ